MGGWRVADRSRGSALLALVHSNPWITRTEIARRLGVGTGLVAELTTRLSTQELIAERPAAPSGARGRPTTALGPNPHGPVVICVEVAHEGWLVSVVELGGGVIVDLPGRHERSARATLEAIAAAVARLRRRFGRRVRAVGISIPGTVSEGRVLQVPNLRWHGVDLTDFFPSGADCPLVTGNDASFAALAEARRGAAAGADTSLHLYFDAGVGGALVERGRIVTGATGVAGEFGHLPFGDPGRPCVCGASGCWNTSMDGHSFARILGEPDPDPAVAVTYERAVIARAEAGEPAAVEAAHVIGREIGRGTAGLVNAFDPRLVTFGGLGRELLALGGAPLREAYLAGLMSFRRADAPPLVAAVLGAEAATVGVAEECFDIVLSDEALAGWPSR